MDSFTANPPQSPSPGTAVVLTCKASNVRPVNGVLISGIAAVDANGNLTVYPKATTTYTCVAINTVGVSVTQTLTVPVGNTPPPGSNAPVFNLPNVAQTAFPNYVIDLTGTTSPDGSYPLTYKTEVLGNTFDTVSNPTSATPTLNLTASKTEVQVQITATDSKGRSSTFILTVYYVGNLNVTPQG